MQPPTISWNLEPWNLAQSHRIDGGNHTQRCADNHAQALEASPSRALTRAMTQPTARLGHTIHPHPAPVAVAVGASQRQTVAVGPSRPTGPLGPKPAKSQQLSPVECGHLPEWPATVAPKSYHTALTERESDSYSRWAIITLHTVLPARPLPLRNFEKAPSSLSERVERGPELIQPRVKVVQVSGARGRRCRKSAGGWSRGAGLRTVIESLYDVAMRRRLKTIEAEWLGR